MKSELKLNLLVKFINPLIPGTEVSNIEEREKQRGITAKHPGGRKISVLLNEDPSKKVVHLSRTQKFSKLEQKVIEEFINLVNIYSDIDEEYFEITVMSNLGYVISNSIIDKKADFVNVFSIIKCLEDWASETYEGANISASIIYYPKDDKKGVIDFKNFIKADCSKVLSNGFDTYVCVNKRGEVFDYKSSISPDSDNYKVPFRHTSLAKESKDGKILFILNRNGEILIIKNSDLLFAKRRGSWKVFNHDTTIQQMSVGGKNFSEELRKNVYATCLDISFSRSGGCIGLIHKSHQEQATNDLVKTEDRLESPGNEKTEFFSKYKEITFGEIKRIHRQEIAGIDGATIINRDAGIISFGAIITIARNDDEEKISGGGRTAAAVQLSKHGIGVKVSEDGQITIFKEMKKRFTIA